jgi:hypothetical protein
MRLDSVILRPSLSEVRGTQAEMIYNQGGLGHPARPSAAGMMTL